jgi:DNA-binding NarL/FixJ family response regulator
VSETAFFLRSEEVVKLGVRLLVVDDHEIVREGVRSLIRECRPEWEICGEATNGAEAIEAIQNLNPDIVILDIAMPYMSGLEAAARIAKLGLACRVLLFTMHEAERLTAEARQVSAHGYVMKSQAARDLIRAIDRVLAGGTFFGSTDPGVQTATVTPPAGGSVA